MELRLSKKPIWPLSRLTQDVFKHIVGWKFKNSPMLGPRIVFIVKKSDFERFTPIIHNRFLSIFRQYYKHPVMLEYDTIEDIERRKKAKQKRDALDLM